MSSQSVVTADRLEHLPEPVQRYMTFTGGVGKPWINTAHVHYVGKFRMAADKPWMPMTAEQWYTTNPPGFLWNARFKIAGLPLMHGHDMYKAGHGHMYGKLAGVFTIFDSRGDELDQASMLRYLNEMTWFPTAFLGQNVMWKAVDERSADVTLHDCGKSVSARMYFDDVGRLTNFVAQRYSEHNGAYTLDTWSTPMSDYGVRAGLNLPVRGQAVWNLPSGDFPYIDVEVKEIAYNEPAKVF
jgi:uncharacterized protein DUF6544